MVSSTLPKLPIPPEPPLSPHVDDNPMYINSLSYSQIRSWRQALDIDKYTTPYTINSFRSHQIKPQADGGANRSVTNLKEILTISWDIAPHNMSRIGDSIVCTAKGLFPLICTNGSTILIEMYYSPDATCIVISPTDIVFNHSDFDSWW